MLGEPADARGLMHQCMGEVPVKYPCPVFTSEKSCIRGHLPDWVLGQRMAQQVPDTHNTGTCSHRCHGSFPRMHQKPKLPSPSVTARDWSQWSPLYYITQCFSGLMV